MESLAGLNKGTSNERCPFFSLPDESISRIFTIGTEIDTARYRESPFFRAFRTSPFVIRPYDATAAVAMTCRRFHSIVQARSNSHFYYSPFAITIGAHEPRNSPLTSEKQFVHTVNALKSAQKCDIHLSIDISAIVYDSTSGLGGYLYHILQLLHSHRSRVAAAVFVIPERLAWVSNMAMRWLDRKSVSWTRLQIVSIRMTIDLDSNIDISAVYTDFYEVLTPLEQEIAFSHPSLVNLDIKHPIEHSFWRRGALNMLSGLTAVIKNGAELSTWSLIRWIFSDSPTIRRVNLRLVDVIPAPDDKDVLRSNIDELTLEVDAVSLYTVFTRFSFPLLVKAGIVFGHANSTEAVPPFFEDIIHFPSLRMMGFAINASHAHVPFLGLCETPPLERVSLAIRRRRLSPLPSQGKASLGPMRKLVVSLEELPQLLSIVPSLLNLSHLEELEIFTWDTHFEGALGSHNKAVPSSPIPVPRLKLVRILEVGSVSDALAWLQRTLLITTPIMLLINHALTFSLEPATSEDPSDEPWFASADQINPAPIYPTNTIVYVVRDHYFDKDFCNRGLICEYLIGVSQDLLTDSAISLPHFRLLTKLQLVIQLLVDPPVDHGWKPPGILHSLSTKSYSSVSDGSILLPSLRIIIINCAKTPQRFVNDALAEPLKRTVLIRKSIGLPLERAEIIANGETTDFAQMDNALNLETIRL
jgi:hypothetical protein